MHWSNNVVIMQTEQLGQIEALEEELRSSKAKMVEMVTVWATRMGTRSTGSVVSLLGRVRGRTARCCQCMG